MRRSEVKELHHITATANLRSIFEHGILSHNAARAQLFDPVDLSNGAVQEIRRNTKVRGKLLHNQSVLYFNARNAALFAMLMNRCDDPRVAGESPLNYVVVLGVDPAVLDKPGVMISDRNAAVGLRGNKRARIKPMPDGLSMIDPGDLAVMRWNDNDEKERLCAEALVPDGIEPTYLTRICVHNSAVEQRIRGMGFGVTVTLDADLFFNLKK